MTDREFAERYVIIKDYFDMVGMLIGDAFDMVHCVEDTITNGDVEQYIEWLSMELDDPVDDEWYMGECKKLLNYLNKRGE